MGKNILLIGTLDTKGKEVTYLKEKIEGSSCQVLIMDCGIRGTPMVQPDITRQEVASAANTTIEALAGLKEVAQAIEVMSQGLSRSVNKLYSSGQVDGIISLGGSLGTSLGTAAMRSLPFGIPKVMVSTVASSDDMRHFVGTKDIIMFHSVSDILGLNVMTKKVLSNAANAITGIVKASSSMESSGRPIIAVSNMGPTTQAASQVKALLEERGYEVIVFHTTGTGGQALEEMVYAGMFNGIFDLSIHEVMAHLYNALHDAGPSRLEAAGSKGITQLVAPGNIDFLTFWPEKMPIRFKGRKFSRHVTFRVNVRPSRAEMVEVGQVVAKKLNEAKGNRAVIIPKKGFSEFWPMSKHLRDSETDSGFVEGLYQCLGSDVAVVEVDAHINDLVFAQEAAKLLIRLMEM